MDSFHPQQCSRAICTLRLLRQSTSSNHRIYPMKLHFTSNAPLDLLSPCTKRTSVSEVRLAMHALFQRLQRYGAIANIALVNLTDPFSAMLDLFRIKLSPFASFELFCRCGVLFAHLTPKNSVQRKIISTSLRNKGLGNFVYIK